MNNEKLFEYATDALYSHGGDGGVLIVFKQQVVDDVADEFERWLLQKYPDTHSMHRLEAHTPGKVMFSDFSNENLHFVQWDDYEKFLRGEISESIPVDEGDYRNWDTVIVTW